LKILLDENFPLQLYRRLRAAGFDAEHVITLGKRGASDSAIRELLRTEAMLFLTQDGEFLDAPPLPPAVVIVSRLPQEWPIARRVEQWFSSITGFLERRPEGIVFELYANGVIAPWKIVK
jgi:hypothetical protein